MILHIALIEKFIPPFIDFIEGNFESSNHQFILIGKTNYSYGLNEKHPILWINKKSKIFTLLKMMYHAEKIILHGLWNQRILQLLFLQPWLLKKCYHVMWGGDFYFPEKQGWIKKQVIKRIGHFITYIKGDYELVKHWYGASGTYHECFMYPSNLYKEFHMQLKAHDTINIQIGNSADPTNNHLEILEKLEQYKDENIKIYAPLSYGNPEYAQIVVNKGREMFGNKFIAMMEFMPFEKYLEFLGEIDIAIFAHKRQQAMGNTITLLGLGKKVYMRSDITPWQLFKDINVKVFDVKNIEIDLINEKTKNKNHTRIKDYFSEEKLKIQMKELFLGEKK